MAQAYFLFNGRYLLSFLHQVQYNTMERHTKYAAPMKEQTLEIRVSVKVRVYTVSKWPPQVAPHCTPPPSQGPEKFITKCHHEFPDWTCRGTSEKTKFITEAALQALFHFIRQTMWGKIIIHSHFKVVQNHYCFILNTAVCNPSHGYHDNKNQLQEILTLIKQMMKCTLLRCPLPVTVFITRNVHNI